MSDIRRVVCDLADGKNWIRERVIDWQPGRAMTVDVYEGTMPLASANVTFGVEALGPSRARVAMTMDYQPKMGVLCAVLDAVVLRRMMRGMLGKVLEGLDREVASAGATPAPPVP